MIAPITPESRRILVTGDAGPDYNIYLPSEAETPPPGSAPTLGHFTRGGAALAYKLLIEAAPEMEIGFDAPPPPPSPTIALWHPHKFGKVVEHPHKEDDTVWRMRRSLNLGQFITEHHLPEVDSPEPCAPDFIPDVVLIEDNAVSFRHPRGNTFFKPERWGDKTPWIVWKMTAPICRGETWWRALDRKLTKRMIVVVSAEDVRLETVRVSEKISWERTALDLAGELSSSPALADLREAAHVVVTLHGEGALWMRRNDGLHPSFTLFFDPEHMEGEWWKKLGAEGEAYGYMSTLAAALAAHVAKTNDPETGLPTGIERGLWAMRALRAYGHGPAKDARRPEYPSSLLGAIIRDGADAAKARNGSAAPPIDPLNFAALGRFGRVTVPAAAIAAGKAGADQTAAPLWRIVETSPQRPDNEPLREPLWGLARRVALFGEPALRDVPYARFGKLLTADRSEIEALRNFKTLIDNYKKNVEDTKPLSLAVFGPPGAGKSFGVQQIAGEILGDKIKPLEFNLSQFKDGDLTGALHQVRDRALAGELPLVFWDEFDSGNYRWLQFMLAPMQDGKFQAGQLTHPIGRCIFVFAGATSYDMANFGPPEPGADADKEQREAWDQFKLLKGPDFKSRIQASLDVAGPNRRPVFKERDPLSGAEAGNWEGDEHDICFPLRRALFLRSQLKLKPKERLKMDQGLLAALLEVSCYTNGSRSLSKICESLVYNRKSHKRSSFSRSDLPADEVLAMNVGQAGKSRKGLAEFKATLDRESAFQSLSERLAPAIHEDYRANYYPQAPAYEDLSAELQADNRAAAKRIPWLLQLVGLYLSSEASKEALSPEDFTQMLEDKDIQEMLAEEEHDLWMAQKQANGWVHCKESELERCDKEKCDREGCEKDSGKKARRDELHKHSCMVKYEKLAEWQKEKDRGNIRIIPRVVARAKYFIVPRKPKEGASSGDGH